MAGRMGLAFGWPAHNLPVLCCSVDGNLVACPSLLTLVYDEWEPGYRISWSRERACPTLCGRLCVGNGGGFFGSWMNGS